MAARPQKTPLQHGKECLVTLENTQQGKETLITTVNTLNKVNLGLITFFHKSLPARLDLRAAKMLDQTFLAHGHLDTALALRLFVK